MKTLPDNKVHK